MQSVLAEAPGEAEAGASGAHISGTQRSVVCCLGMALLLLAFYWRFITSQPQLAYTFSDFTNIYWPLHAFDVREWLAGRVPLWNDSIFGGEPQLANLAAGVFYPFSIVELLMHGRGSVMSGLYTRLWLDSTVASLGLFALLLHWTGSRAAGVLAGLTFSLSSFLTGFASMQLVLLESLVWLPLGVLCLDRALTGKRRVAWAIPSGWCFGVCLLAGYPQMALLVVPVVLFQGLCRWWTGAAPWPAVVRVVLVSGLCALTLSAIQLVPAAELFWNSNRDTGAVGVGAGYHLNNLLGLLIPDAAGDKGLYVGLLPLALAVLALLSRRRRALAWTWLALAGTGFLIAMGNSTPLYGLLFAHLGFGLFRGQGRVVGLTALALAVLGGLGLAEVLRRLSSRAGRRNLWVGVLAVVVAAANLLYVNWGNDWPESFTPFISLPPGLAATLTRDQQREPMRFAVDREGLFPPNEAFLLGLQTMNGDIDFIPQRTDELMQQVDSWRQMQLFNVRWLLTSHNVQSPGFAAVPTGPGAPILYRMKYPLPRAYVVWSARQAGSPAAALAQVKDSAFDPGTTVVLEAPLARPLAVPADTSQSIKVASPNPQEVDIRAATRAAGFLVLSYAYYPGWLATIDGQPASLMRANFAFEGLPLPAGQHLVQLLYRPRSFALGAAISLGSVVLLLSWLVLEARRRASGAADYALLEFEADAT
ncbi:MAG: YfhO family protein [Chloroflexota bacterium]